MFSVSLLLQNPCMQYIDKLCPTFGPRAEATLWPMVLPQDILKLIFLIELTHLRSLMPFELFLKRILVCPEMPSHLPGRCPSLHDLSSPQEPEGTKGRPSLVT